LSAPVVPTVSGLPSIDAGADLWSAVQSADADRVARLLGLADADSLDASVLSGLGRWWQRQRLESTISAARYRVTWQPISLPTGGARLSGTWWVLCGERHDTTWLDAVLGVLKDHNAATEILRLPPQADRDGVAEHLRPLTDGEPPAGVLWLPSMADGLSASVETLAVVQALGDARVAAPLWCLTSGAVSVGAPEQPRAPEAATVWGLGRVVALEHPERWGGLIDVPATPTDAVLDRLAAAIANPAAEDQIAVRAEGVFARRLLSAPYPATPTKDAWRANGTVLMVGGAGMTGRQVARWLAENGARRLLLASPVDVTNPPEFEGCEVTSTRCDLGDRNEVDALVRRAIDEGGIDAVFCVIDQPATGAVDELDAAQLSAALDQVRALTWIDAATRDIELDALVVISSAAGIWGAGGLGAYAAASAGLDAIAEHRAPRRFTVNLACTAWRTDDEDDGYLRRHGITPLPAEHGLTALWHALTHRDAPHVYTNTDWQQFLPGYTAARPSPLLAHLGPAPESEPDTTVASPLRGRLNGLTARDALRVLLELVRTHAAEVLGYDSPEELSPGTAFKDVGFDSLTAVELRDRLKTATGMSLPTTLVFDYPNPRSLAQYLWDELSGEGHAVEQAALPARAADADDPIVIVGMACRYPGDTHSPDDLWRLVAEERDAIGEFPTDRGWDLEALYDPDPDNPGTSYTREGGFLYQAAEFDAGFFGISPREALGMDPQQRLLLEVSWESLEHAGVDPIALRGRQIGVFVGNNGQDYVMAVAGAQGAEDFVATGNAGSVVSGRVSYALGLEGPAVTVDTACSSSLVALHLATQALRAGECELAMVSGVTVMATPASFIGFSRQRGLAADGRCKSFADAADGTGWGEGVGVLVVERLSRARELGHRVWGVVRGSAVNQDGASNGLTAPNGPSQQRVIRAALAQAGLTADQVDVVEAHGTGTTLGDPIEAQAVQATYGQAHNAESPLWLGSIKSNIGHTQAAAGVAGIIKMLMAMHHGRLPKTLHVDQPSRHIDWSQGAVELLTEARDWPANGRPRRAGVSSFGASGTNAHVILEEPPALDAEHDDQDTEQPMAVPATPSYTGDVVVWPISGRGATGLYGQAKRLANFADANPDLSPATVSALLLRRSELERRGVILGAEPAELRAGLAALAVGEPHARVVEGKAGTTTDGLVWVFAGQGSQRAGMGAELYGAFPVFARVVDEACGLFDAALAGVDGLPAGGLKALMFAPDEADALNQTVFTQASLFVFEVALARLLESLGVKPDALVGHSIGEVVAAHIAGVFGLDDAVRLVAARGRLMQSAASGGAMAAIAADVDAVKAWLVEGAEIAGVNGLESVSVSGPEDAVERVMTAAKDAGVRCTRLRVSHAFHSAAMEPVLDEFAKAIADIAFAEPSIPVISNVTGRPAAAELAAPEYWVTQIRKPVLFHDGISYLTRHGHTHFLELAPSPTLSAHIQQDGVQAVGLLRKERPEVTSLLAGVASWWVRGGTVDWGSLLPAEAKRQAADLTLPTYAFQHEHYWLRGNARGGDPAGLGLSGLDHPLLGASVELAEGGSLLTGRISLNGCSWLADHAISGVVVVAGATIVEWLIRAGDEVGCPLVRELALQTPLIVPEQGAVHLQIRIGEPDATGHRDVGVYARPEAGGEWTCHATGVLAEDQDVDTDPVDWPASWPPALAGVELDDFYENLVNAGYNYGPAFQGLRGVWQDADRVWAEVSLPSEAGEPTGLGIHPALIDAMLHALGWALPDNDQQGVGLPFVFSRARLHATGATTLRVCIRATGDDRARIVAVDPTGGPVLSIDEVAIRAIDPTQLRATQSVGDVERDLYTLSWTPQPPTDDTVDDARWVVVTGADGASVDLRSLASVGVTVSSVADVAELDDDATPDVLVWVAPRADHAEDGARRARDISVAGMAVVQNWLADERLAGSRLLVLTRGATDTVGTERVDLAAAAVAGMMRSVQAENPGRVWLVDIDQNPDSWKRLPAVIAGDEPQAHIRDGVVHALRLDQVDAAGTLTPPVDGPAWRLDSTTRGSLENLALVPHEVDRPLGPGQVRIAIRAAGVNFRDVLIALGMYPGAGDMGNEAAGVITEVAPDVTAFAPGDRVLGLVPYAFSPSAIADQRVLVRIPRGWSFAQAASVPMVFLTAYYGLVDLSGLQAGESVLIHAAAGGVGMAATQLARQRGAEVFATASQGKWDTLRAHGLDDAHIASSRTTDFSRAFLAATGGRGVDVVLNSLAGEFIDASFALMPRGGRFAEMGKTDLRNPAEVARRHPGLEYQAFDLTSAGPDRIQQMFAELMKLFESGSLRPLPVRAWDIRHAAEAFRFISQAKHVGKVVLTIEPELDRDGTVLVTGGTGTLGRIIARHLAGTRGVRHLVLASRRGADAAGAAETIAELAELGAEARIVACDVSDRDAVGALVAGIPAEHPLTGVVHAAGVADDGVITSLTPERVEGVLRPKANAAWNLHQATQDADLAMFAMYSSAAGIFGGPGQANYAAANSFLDALAAQRRRDGLPGVALAWGTWAEASEITGNLSRADLQRMARSGIVPLESEHGVALFDAAQRLGLPLVVPVRFDTASMGAPGAAAAIPPLFRNLVRGSGRRVAADGQISTMTLAQQIAGMSGADAERTAIETVRTLAAAVLGYGSAASIDPDQEFKSLGFDSLTSIELRNRLNAATELHLPATLIFDYPNPRALARFLITELGPIEPTEAVPAIFAELDRFESSLLSMAVASDDQAEVTSRLRATLAKWTARLGGDDSGLDLTTATREEVFALIDDELGLA
jgi:candicidin polyketide synthase FscB